MGNSITHYHSPRVKDDRDKKPTDWFGKVLLGGIIITVLYALVHIYFI